MSDVNLKLVGEFVDCDGCFYLKGDDCSHHCAGTPKESKMICINTKSIWVIDEPAIKTDKSVSPWVKIEDAELADGERYDIFDGEYQFVGVYSVDVNSSAFITDLDIIPDNDITHVIHLPKPTPPSEL